MYKINEKWTAKFDSNKTKYTAHKHKKVSMPIIQVVILCRVWTYKQFPVF